VSISLYSVATSELALQVRKLKNCYIKVRRPVFYNLISVIYVFFILQLSKFNLPNFQRFNYNLKVT